LNTTAPFESLLDAGGNVVAVPRLILELREDEQFGGAFLQGVIVGWRLHMS
jgi:hypothetical protein